MAIAVSRASRSRGSRSRDAGRCRMPFRRRATGGDQGTVTDCCSPPAAICDASSRSSRSSLKVISTARGRPTAGKLVRPEEMATFGKAPGVSGRLLTRARCERSQARTPNSIYGTRLDPRSVGMISRKLGPSYKSSDHHTTSNRQAAAPAASHSYSSTRTLGPSISLKTRSKAQTK